MKISHNETIDDNIEHECVDIFQFFSFNNPNSLRFVKFSDPKQNRNPET